MHFCYLTNEYPKPGQAHGGIGSFLKVICPALVQAGHQVSVINGTYGTREIVYSEGLIIFYIPFSKKRGVAWWHNYGAVDRELTELHGHSPIDVVEGSELSFAFIKKRKDIAFVIRMHGGHHFFTEGEQRKLNKWKAYQEKRSFTKADGFIGVSQYVINHTSKFLQIGNRLICVIMNPINLSLFSGASFNDIVPFRMVFAGTIIEKKGIRQLVQAMDNIVVKFPLVELHAYGRDWIDSEGSSFLGKLMDIIPDHLKRQIHFHGYVEQIDLPEIFSKSHLCVFPSHIETLGLVAPEAMAMQRAVVYTQIGPGPEVITPGESGWLCDPYDPIDIASKIIEAFSDEEELRRRAEIGFKKVRKQFNIDSILDQNINFYKEVIEAKARK
ncbi:MAG: glycosyltransferase involved in cell wall biosynthesis [Algoriphagus sp.]|jgi:glycosyltransferase involved in cell wall biosynthesis